MSRAASTNADIVQFKIDVPARKKREALRYILQNDNVSTAIVFANRKTTVRELAKSLKSYGFSAGEIHGDMEQPARLAELALFKEGKINILCASDVAARGLDVKGVSHVINFDCPWHPDDYVHRVGRTGRAGAKGRAFTLIAPEDAEALDNVEKLTGAKLPAFDFGTVKPVETEPAVESAETEKPARKSRARSENTADAKPERKPRGGRQAKPKVEPEIELEPVVEPLLEAEVVARETVKPSEDSRPRRDRAPHKAPDRQSRPPRNDYEEPTEPGVWNGPVPEFLGVSAL